MTSLKLITNDEHQSNIKTSEDHVQYLVGGPMVLLKISSLAENEIHSLCEAYDLAVHFSYKNETVVKTKQQVIGEHKKQALILFITSLEVRSRFQHSTCILYQVNELKNQILPGINQKPHISNAKFVLDNATAFYIQGLGYEIFQDSKGNHYVSDDSVARARGEILEKSKFNKATARMSA